MTDFRKFYKKVGKYNYKTWLLLIIGYIEMKNKQGKTPLMQACINGRPDIVELLLISGADPNIRDEAGNSPLTCASSSSYGNLEIIKSLLNHGADINAKVYNGWPPLFFAFNNYEVVKLLLERGADANARDDDGRSMFIFAISQKVDELLREYGAKCGAK